MKKQNNKLGLIIGIILISIGFLLLFIKGKTDYIDTNGLLHEKFFLIPVGYVLILSGLIITIIRIIRCKKNKLIEKEKI